MKKFLLMIMLCFSFLTMTNAQVATENSKLFDNVYAGVEAGVTTPLDFNSVFPVNTVAGLKLGKELTPVFGLELEGLTMLNDNHFSDLKTSFKNVNVGLNGTINIGNLFNGYKGSRQTFEVKTNTGIGWLHYFDNDYNYLSAKTGLDFQFAFGKKKALALIASPVIYWNLNKNGNIKFNKHNAQFAVLGTLAYYFKTSNGTHSFKTYDVGAMIWEIDRLNSELTKKPTEVIKQIETIKTVTEVVQKQFVVQFAQNSSQLTEEAKETLDKVKGNVNVIAYASPEGSRDYNNALSEKRAAVIADYLTKNNVKVITYRGIGSLNESSNRIAIIEVIE